jgi:endonuclease YncB( thermonuclease family)/DNA-directed RNA polymerase subunit RPC12/RpoP
MSEQAIYCLHCDTENIVPLKSKLKARCVHCGHRLRNPLSSAYRRSLPIGKTLSAISTFLSVSVVAVIGGFWILDTVSRNVPDREFDASRDVKIYRGGETREGEIEGRASVIDGDTIEIGGVRIRLWGVDAPEGKQRCYRRGKPWRCGTSSANGLAASVGTRTVTCTEKTRDRYGRIVATCKVGGEDIGAGLVSNGWALDYKRYSKGAYSFEQRQAEAERRGIWQGEFELPWKWRRNNR